MKDNISVITMKIIRRIKNKIQDWYRYTEFVSGLKQYGENVNVRGNFQLWNDNVYLGDDVNIDPNVTLWGKGVIDIGNNVEVGIGSVIYSDKHVTIGNNVLIAAYCYIIDSNHGIQKEELIRKQPSNVKGDIVIKDDVWLGSGAKILSGVSIGKGAVIGAQAVVNKDIPDYAIAVGVPAKVIGFRK